MYKESPYRKTLFIDSDTYFYESCEGIFTLLDYFDAAMALAPVREQKPMLMASIWMAIFPTILES